jgi:ribosomal protein S18 acetylase RimI-like enzyme
LIHPRPYSEENDLIRMRNMLESGKQCGSKSYYVHPGDVSWWTFYLDNYEEPSQRIILWETGRPGSTLAGWSYFSSRYRSFDLFCDPRFLSTPEKEWMLDRTIEEAVNRNLLQKSSCIRTYWVSEHDTELIHLLENRGFTRDVPCMFHMVCNLDASYKTLTLPEGFSFGRVTSEADLVKRAYSGYLTFSSSDSFDHYLEKYRRFWRSTVYREALDLVITTPSGEIAAFCICWVDRETKTGLIEPLGTVPGYQKQGLGRSLISESKRYLLSMGMDCVTVNTESDNLPARSLYLSTGFTLDQRIHSFKMDFPGQVK